MYIFIFNFKKDFEKFIKILSILLFCFKFSKRILPFS